MWSGGAKGVLAPAATSVPHVGLAGAQDDVAEQHIEQGPFEGPCRDDDGVGFEAPLLWGKLHLPPRVARADLGLFSTIAMHGVHCSERSSSRGPPAIW